jgi:hypothetical protein
MPLSLGKNSSCHPLRLSRFVNGEPTAAPRRDKPRPSLEAVAGTVAPSAHSVYPSLPAGGGGDASPRRAGEPFASCKAAERASPERAALGCTSVGPLGFENWHCPPRLGIASLRAVCCCCNVSPAHWTRRGACCPPTPSLQKKILGAVVSQSSIKFPIWLPSSTPAQGETKCGKST